MVLVPAQFSGMHSITSGEGGQSFSRLNAELFFPPSTSLLENRAAMAAGVRAGWLTSGGTLRIAGVGASDAAPYDVVVNGALVHRLAAAGEQSHQVELGELAEGSDVELWLPHYGDLLLTDASFEGAEVAVKEETGPRWITYGSSITHCQQADGPTQTWPTLVAKANGWRLQNLGLAGECQLDPAASATIAESEADLISLCLGINSYNASTYSERTFAGAIAGFLATVRRAHPTTPIVVISPVLSLPREDKPNAVGWTLQDYRLCVAETVQQLIDRGDQQLHLVDGRAVLTAQESLDRMPDTLHPDTEGYAIMAERLAPVLKTYLP